MSKEKDVVSKPTIIEDTYSKEQFVKAKFLYSGLQRDILSIVLEDGKEYTKNQAEKLIEGFLKGEY